MKRALLAIAILFSTVAIASANDTRDVVSLKNGSIIKGSIVEQTPNESIKIETADGSTFVYNWDEVAKVTKEPVEKTSTTSTKSSTKSESSKPKVKYSGEVQAGWGLSIQGVDADRAYVGTVQGVDINNHFKVGIGAGVNIVMPNDMPNEKSGVYIPIFVNAKAYTHLTKSISLIGSVDIGGSFGVSENLKDFGGLLVATGAGIEYKKVSIIISYEVQRDNDEEHDYVRRFDAVTFKAGFRF